jgi:hypothetical protein
MKSGLTYPGNDISACVKLLLANGAWHPGYPPAARSRSTWFRAGFP